VREEDAGGREAGAPSDLKMPLENGRADERVCVFITAGPVIKLCAGGEGDSEGHV
jgi:hypothetical protein